MSRAAIIRAILIFGLIALLEFACRTGAVSRAVAIAPSQMLVELYGLLISGQMNSDIVRTLSAVGTSITTSVVLGFSIGFALHRIPTVRQAVEPFLAAYYAIPHFAFYPLLVVIFGFGVLPYIILAILFAFVAMIAATLSGLDRVPQVLGKSARIYRFSLTEEVWHISLPAAAPYIFSGIKLAIAYSFIAVLAGEFIMSTAGVGHAISYAYDNFDTPKMYALILLLLVAVGGLNMYVLAVEKRMLQRRGL